MRAWLVVVLPCVGCTVLVNASDVPVRCVIPAEGRDPCPEGFTCIDGECLVRTARDGGVVDAASLDAGPPDARPRDAGVDPTCETSPECATGDVGTESEPCGTCGTRTRTRTCNAVTCRWNAFGPWGACVGEGEGECAPGEAVPCPNGDPCGHVVCRDDCTWGECEPVSECLRVPAGTMGVPGSNYRCCAPQSWQFCLPDCTWSTACEMCSGCPC